jgi:hypothetical protein
MARLPALSWVQILDLTGCDKRASLLLYKYFTVQVLVGGGGGGGKKK